MSIISELVRWELRIPLEFMEFDSQMLAWFAALILSVPSPQLACYGIMLFCRDAAAG